MGEGSLTSPTVQFLRITNYETEIKKARVLSIPCRGYCIHAMETPGAFQFQNSAHLYALTINEMIELHFYGLLLIKYKCISLDSLTN